MRNHYGGFFKNLNNAAVHLPKKIKNSLLSIVKDNEEFQKKDKWGADQPMLDSSGNPTIIDLELHPYKKLTLTALEVWKSNKIFGNGIKSFRFECHKIVNEQKRGLCSSHPHNYYMEILVDLGILGLICLTAIGLIFLVFIKKNYKIFKKENNLQNLLLLAAIISLFLEGFPLRSSGSFFSTNNTTHIILMSSIILSYKKLIKGKNFE